MNEPTQLPHEDELLEVLRESVQEVFSSCVGTFKHAAVLKESHDAALVFHDESGQCVETKIDLEVEVGFSGAMEGAVVVRCTAQGATDIARGLLMLDADTSLALNEIEDALGECANMVGGVMKRRALDPRGEFRLGLPTVRRDHAVEGRRGKQLVYQLSAGVVSLELWLGERKAA